MNENFGTPNNQLSEQSGLAMLAHIKVEEQVRLSFLQTMIIAHDD